MMSTKSSPVTLAKSSPGIPAIFEKDLIIHTNTPPPGIQNDLKLTLDEFCMFDSTIQVQKVRINATESETVTIESACKAQRKGKHSKQDAVHFSLAVSCSERLDELIELPRVIKSKSLYENHWPQKYVSTFFKNKRKMFHAYQEGYSSRPYIAYGGMTEWIYIMTGSMTVCLFKPTELNLIKYSTLSEQDNFVAQLDTTKKVKIEEGHFLVIPPGWISSRKAHRTTFALGGEMLHQDDLEYQLALFEKNCGGRWHVDIDTEIRYLYWFSAVHLLRDPINSKEQLKCLKSYLERWRKKNDARFEPSSLVPFGLRCERIVKDVQRLFSAPRKSVRMIC